MLYLGIDGGGTKTEFLLADEKGSILAREILSGSNPTDVGVAATQNILDQGIQRVCKGLSKDRISVFAGISGGITGDNKNQIQRFLSTFGFAAAGNGSDAENAVAAALGQRNGIAVILGTGAIAFAKQGNSLTRFGGYGHLLGDGGSGFSIGRDAVVAALRDQDETGPKTAITKLVQEKCGVQRILDCLGMFYSDGKRVLASFAPVVFQAYNAGDPVAEGILRNNMLEAAVLIRQAAKDFSGDSVPVVLCGSVALRQKAVITLIKEELSKDSRKYRLDVCRRSMVEGALLLAGLKEDALC